MASAAAHQTMLSDAKLRAAFDFIDADADGRISKGARSRQLVKIFVEFYPYLGELVGRFPPCLACMAHAQAIGNVLLRWCC